MSERVYLLAILFLGLCALAAIGGAVVCAIEGREIPSSIAAIIGTCLGALGGLLSQPQQPRPPDRPLVLP